MKAAAVKPGEEVLPLGDRSEMADELEALSDQASDPEIIEPGPVTAATRKIGIGGGVVTKATEGLREDQRTLIRWLHDFAMTKDMNWEALEVFSGISRSVLHRVWKGEYNYPLRVFEDTGHIDDKGNKIKVSHPHPKGGQPISLDNVCDKIKKAKLRAEKVQSLYSVGFLKTSIWERTEWGCLQALKHNRIVFQYGAPQIGKTACAEEFAHQHNGGQTTLVRTPPSGGVQSLLKAVARALHVNAHKCHDDLLQDVIDALDRSKLLIIDEVHEIFITYTKSSVVRCLETLRYIWDQTHCGMVLIGTNVFRNELHEGELMKLMRQLLLRGLREVQHPDVVPDEDLELALESFGLPWPEEAKLLEDFRHLAQDGIGKVMMRLNDGRSVAEKKGLPYTWEHFVTARNVVHKLARGGKK